MLAYDYPLLGFFWSMLIFFLWVAWFMLLFRILADIFRSHDLGGGGKTLWVLFVIFMPFLGVFVYLLARGKSMNERAMEDAVARQQAMNQYVQQTAGSSASTADELTKFASLRAQGVLTDAEFEAKKAQLLG